MKKTSNSKNFKEQKWFYVQVIFHEQLFSVVMGPDNIIARSMDYLWSMSDLQWKCCCLHKGRKNSWPIIRNIIIRNNNLGRFFYNFACDGISGNAAALIFVQKIQIKNDNRWRRWSISFFATNWNRGFCLIDRYFYQSSFVFSLKASMTSKFPKYKWKISLFLIRTLLGQALCHSVISLVGHLLSKTL